MTSTFTLVTVIAFQTFKFLKIASLIPLSNFSLILRSEIHVNYFATISSVMPITITFLTFDIGFNWTILSM